MQDFLSKYWQEIGTMALLCVDLIAIVKSLTLIRKSTVTKYLVVITGFFILTFLQMFISHLDRLVIDPNNQFNGRNSFSNIFLLIYMIFEYSIYTYLLLLFINSELIKKYMKICMIIFLLIVNISWFSQLPFVKMFSIISLTESVFLLIPAFYYFYEILKGPPVLELSQEPSFWIVTGIVFLQICLIPIYVGLLTINKIVPIQSLDYLGYILIILLFLKGITCRTVKTELKS